MDVSPAETASSPAKSDTAGKSAPASQTLDRGLRVLELLAERRRPMWLEDIAEQLDLHRSIIYRMVRTLEEHQLVKRVSSGGGGSRYELGAGLAVLARQVAPALQTTVSGYLSEIAEDLKMTCFLAVRDHDDCITLSSVEPRDTLGTIAQRPGSRHPLTVGAPGAAILAIGSYAERELPQAIEVAEKGYAVSHGTVIPGVSSVAVPLTTDSYAQAALAVIYLNTDKSESDLARKLQHAVLDISMQLSL